MSNTVIQPVSRKNKIASYLQACNEVWHMMGSILIGDKKEKMFCQSYGMANLEHSIPNTAQTKFRIASLTKQITAAAVLTLYQKGSLDLTDYISNYFPNFPSANSITIHHLLNHTSGISNFTELPVYRELIKTGASLDEVISYFKDLPLEFSPGSSYSYSNSGYILLTKIIELVSHQSYSQYLKENIFQPLHMFRSGCDKNSAILEHRASGYEISDSGYQNAEFVDMSIPSGAGGLFSTVEDLYTWHCSLNTRNLFDQSLLRIMFSPTQQIASDQETYYGYGWFLDHHLNERRASHSGCIEGFSCKISRYLESDLVIIVLCNVADMPVNQITDDLAAILLGHEYQTPIKPAVLNPNSLFYEKYTGVYDMNEAMSVSITTEEKRIFANFSGTDKYEILPTSRTNFFFKSINAQIEFSFKKNQKAEGFLLQKDRRKIFLKRRYSQ